MRIGWRIGVTVAAMVAVAGGVLLVGYIADTAGRDDAFVIEHFDREVVVDEHGISRVTETIDVRFLESRRGIFRDLPYAGPTRDLLSYTIDAVDQGDPSRPWTTALERDVGLLRVRIGDANVWLDPGVYRYRLQYTMHGLPFAVDEAWADGPARAEVRVDVPGDRWPTEVQATTLRVSGPSGVLDAVCVQGMTGSVAACDQTPSAGGSDATVAIGHLEPGETATVAVQFAADAFSQLAEPRDDLEPLGTADPNPVVRLELDRRTAAILLALLFALPFLSIQLIRGLVVYRDQKTDPAVHDREHPTALPAPPYRLRPPEVAGLLLRQNGDAMFLATLVDLDQRGSIVATRTGAKTLTVTTAPSPVIPSPDDAEFLAALEVGVRPLHFDGKYDPATTARVSAASAKLGQRAGKIFATRGLLHSRGAWLTKGWFPLIQALAVLGYLVVLVWQATVSTPLPGWAVGVIAGLVLVGLMVGVAPWRHHRLPLNSEGRDTVAQARAFHEFVRTVESEQLEWAADQPGIDHLHPAVSLLPYAVALGLADSWYARFGEVMAELAARAPGAAAAGGAAWWATQRNFQEVSSAQRGSTTAPSSSSSSGGGGGSGSGGGGGGGGSW